jgi:lipid-binding SYLF domain-containing protein
MRPLTFRLVLAFLALFTVSGCHSTGDLGSEPDQLADNARITFQGMMSDNQYPSLVDLTSRAKAIIIVPNLIRAAFFFGGRGGNGVMLAHGTDGRWSAPAFYTIGGLSWGLQLGGQSSELVIAVMTEKGLNAIMSREVTLGGDAGLAIGELGKGVNAATGIGYKADMYAFARSQGLFVGVSLEGSVIAPRNSWNQQVYGQGTTPHNILVDQSVNYNSQAVRGLVAAMP